MGRHRQVRGGRRVASRTRPRYTRLTAAGGALVVTLVAVLGGMGVLPADQAPAEAASAVAPAAEPRDPSPGRTGAISLSDATVGQSASQPPLTARAEQAGSKNLTPPVPRNSGHGRRIVFDQTDQRVWLVEGTDPTDGDRVRRTYLVSGSLTDNLQPGTYSVYSKSEQAWGIEDSGTMKYMVRFAHGPNAAIGFHDIPVLNGEKVQTRAELGTAQSHGCIRQWRPDAIALWRFAPLNTKVVVV
jgi:hypothetical protein